MRRPIEHGLGAPIGVEDHLAGQIAAQRDGLAQCVLDEVGMQTVAHGAPEHPASVPVPDGAQVRPPLTCVQIRDVGEPRAVPISLIELSLDEIGDGERIRSLHRGRRMPGPWTDPSDPFSPHELRDCLA